MFFFFFRKPFSLPGREVTGLVLLLALKCHLTMPRRGCSGSHYATMGVGKDLLMLSVAYTVDEVHLERSSYCIDSTVICIESIKHDSKSRTKTLVYIIVY